MPYYLKASSILDAWKGTKRRNPATSLLSMFPVQDSTLRVSEGWSVNGPFQKKYLDSLQDTLKHRSLGIAWTNNALEEYLKLLSAWAVLSESAAKHWFSARLLVFWGCSSKHRRPRSITGYKCLSQYHLRQNLSSRRSCVAARSNSAVCVACTGITTTTGRGSGTAAWVLSPASLCRVLGSPCQGPITAGGLLEQRWASATTLHPQSANVDQA